MLNNGTPVTMKNWINQVPGLIEAWLPGQEGGAALAAIIFGDVNPSGKLPDTLAVNRADYPDAPEFPGVRQPKRGEEDYSAPHTEVHYTEGIYVGYRHFDKEKIEPLFPFGYGLSYTTFTYSNLNLSRGSLLPDGTVDATVDVTNAGTREGEEVVELYIHDPQPHIDKPVRELKGFVKVALRPGETKHLKLAVRPRDLAYFDTSGRQWKADAGVYEVGIGASSRDIRQRAELRLESPFTEAVYEEQ